ncbi:MAG TPA: nucleotide exchange factor GrpE [Candidatus Paceibacterota bacterium]
MSNTDEFNDQDPDFEADDEFIEEDLQQTVKRLKTEMKALKKERQEYLEGWQRSKADYINREQEMKDETDKVRKRTRQALLEEFLTISDSFESAMSNKEVWESVPANWRTGIEYIAKQLNTIFENNQLAQIPVTLHAEPDHATQEILKEESVTDESLHHKVIGVGRSGWKIGNTVVRPAQVIIGNYQQ